MARDDFKKTTIDKLRDRVTGRCSNPDCRVPTTAPVEKSEKVNSIGTAAHICAASSGGPRYLAQMSVTERKSFDNGIWLCSNCARDIDRDVGHYTVELLKEWKLKSEKLARKEIGKRRPAQEDAIDTVAAALTGFPKNFLATAISNVHTASARSLEDLDPRFAVRSSFSNGVTHFGIHAKEDVNVTMTFQDEDIQAKMARLLKHGEPVELNTAGISVDGSKLIEEITSLTDDGKLVISPGKVKALQKLWVVNRGSGAIEHFDDMHGEVSLGSESFDFHGRSCGDMFSIHFRKKIEISKTTINLHINFEKWNGLDIRNLPYLNKLERFFCYLIEGWKLYSSVEIDGKELTRSRGVAVNEEEFIKDIEGQLYFISLAAKLASYLGREISFTPEYSISNEELKLLQEAVAIYEGTYLGEGSSLNDNPVSCLSADSLATLVENLENIKEPIEISLPYNEQRSLELFGQHIKLPPRVLVLRSVLPRIKSLVTSGDGNAVDVEWIPADDFKFDIRF